MKFGDFSQLVPATMRLRTSPAVGAPPVGGARFFTLHLLYLPGWGMAVVVAVSPRSRGPVQRAYYKRKRWIPAPRIATLRVTGCQPPGRGTQKVIWPLV